MAFGAIDITITDVSPLSSEIPTRNVPSQEIQVTKLTSNDRLVSSEDGRFFQQESNILVSDTRSIADYCHD
jgi:hypothetical protein